MVPDLSQVRRRAAHRMVSHPVSSVAAPGAAEGVIIPYDHAATFELTGRPGNIAQGVINVGSDGVFVATAIGYGFEEQRARPINGPGTLTPAKPVIPGNVQLDQLPLAALIEGFRISPRF